MSLPNMTIAGVPDTLSAGLGELADAAAVAVRELLDDCAPGDPMVARLEMVRRTLDRLVSVSGHLHALARRHGARSTVIDLHAVVQDLNGSLQRLLGPFIALDLILPGAGSWVAQDRAVLEQVVLGLLLNIREALPLGGHVRLAPTRWTLTEPFQGQAGALAAGEWAALEVRCRGAGIDGRVLLRLLAGDAVAGSASDSTLSLAAIAAAVRSAGGDIVLRTAGDGETMLAACFPAAPAPRLRQPATGVANAILVVDDDEWVRLSSARGLRRAGYGVLEATDAADAIELLDDVAGSCVRMVIADAAMVDGRAGALGELIVRERPEIELIVLTPPGASAAVTLGRTVLAKPFAAEGLVALVRARLDRPAEPALP
ncbi:MAG TPA: hypothetical protein VGM77_10290 [Gemmatimonadales bacterium]